MKFKIMPAVLAATMTLLSLVSCSNISESNDNDITENKNELSVYEDVEESYIVELYESLLGFHKVDRWTMIFHTDNKVTIDDLTMDQIKFLAYWSSWETPLEEISGVSEAGIAYTDDYYDYEFLKSNVGKLFGPDVEVDTESWMAAGYNFTYDESVGMFLAEPAYGGDSAARFVTQYCGKYEQDGEFLYIYDRAAYAEGDSNTGDIKVYSSPDKTEDSLFCEMNVGYNYTRYTVDTELMLEHGIEYKHTFKRAEDGTYYWISSEPVTE